MDVGDLTYGLGRARGQNQKQEGAPAMVSAQGNGVHVLLLVLSESQCEVSLRVAGETREAKEMKMLLKTQKFVRRWRGTFKISVSNVTSTVGGWSMVLYLAQSQGLAFTLWSMVWLYTFSLTQRESGAGFYLCILSW